LRFDLVGSLSPSSRQSRSLPLAVTGPALTAQDRLDPPVAVSWLTTSEQLQPLPEQRLLRNKAALVALQAAMLARQLAGPPLGDPEAITQTLNRSAPSLRAQKFPGMKMAWCSVSGRARTVCLPGQGALSENT
jgi:hypothetical protein